MLKLKLIDRDVKEAMRGDEELYDLVSKTESILDEMLNMSDVCINNISDNDMKVINDSINISKSILIMVAHKREALYSVLKNQETIMHKINDIDRKIDNLDQMELV